MTPGLYTPPDCAQAYNDWKANCGPAALASLLRKTMAEVRDYFPRFPGKPWVNPTHIKAAMELAGVKYTATKKDETGQHVCPAYGLCFIQFDGPWSGDYAKILEAYRHTHWVAVSQTIGLPTRMYDINADGWLSQHDWGQTIEPRFMAENQKYTGTWWVRWACEVQI